MELFKRPSLPAFSYPELHDFPRNVHMKLIRKQRCTHRKQEQLTSRNNYRGPLEKQGRRSSLRLEFPGVAQHNIRGQTVSGIMPCRRPKNLDRQPDLGWAGR